MTTTETEVGTLSEAEFERAADRTLQQLSRVLDALELDAEIELSMGILSIDFPDGTKYVINSHRAAKQIWMAAERTAWHFDLEGGASPRWVAKKTGEELVATLESVLARKLGRMLSLRPA